MYKSKTMNDNKVKSKYNREILVKMYKNRLE